MAIIQMDFFSNCVMKTIHAQVILPCGESDRNVEPPFKTLYFLPGFTDAANDTMTRCSFRLFAMEHGLALIIVDGDNSFYVDHGPMSEYSRMIGEELLPLTRKLFPLSTQKEDTFIGGMSMGGYGALYNGLRYAEKFSKIALLAPGFDFYNIHVPGTEMNMFPASFLNVRFGSEEAFETTDLNYRVAFEHLEQKGISLPKIFHSCGDEDLLVGAANKVFKEFWQEKNYPVTYKMVPGGHDEVFFRNILSHFFSFLSEKNN